MSTLKLIAISSIVLSRTISALSNYSQLESIKEIPTRCSKIWLLSGNNKQKFLLKQRIKQDPKSQIMTIIETLGGMIAEGIHLPSNHVELIPAGDSCPLKFFKDRSATLHSFVPGVTIKRSKQYKKLDINQSCKRSKETSCGLTLKLLANLALHKDLPPIAALDTFIGNNNRHKKNLMYDEQGRKFHSIDYGCTFETNLAIKSVSTIRSLLKSKNMPLNNKELKALIAYKQTLARLISLYLPRYLIQKFDELFNYSQIEISMASDADFAQGVQERIKIHKRFIQESYQDSKLLLSLISQLIDTLRK